MKKSLFVAVTVLIAAVGCTRSQEMDIQKGDMNLVAKTETPGGSRTVVEDGTHVYWEPGDEIKVFSGDKSGKFRSELTESAATATFNGTLGKGVWTEGMDLWAVYPYSESAVLDGETIMTVLPNVQVARAGSFGKDMNLAIAHSTTETLQFYNVGGGVRFSLQEDGIREVVLEGLDGDVLAGTVTLEFENGKPVIRTVTEGKTSITLTAPEGEAFQKDEWYFIVAIPGTLEKGFKLFFHKAGKLGDRTFDKPVTINRSRFGTLTHADEGVAYTPVSDGNIAFKDALVKSIVVRYFDTGGDGELSYREAAVVLSFLVDESETRSSEGKVSIFAGTGITSFDELVYFTGLTRIEDGVFAGCTELKSVTIPENITAIGDNAFNGCSGLESITLTSTTPPAIGTNAFANTGDCPIIVPAGSVEEYVSAWSEYADRIAPSHSYAIPEAIDLGLPSGAWWASFNLGATAPEEYGDYFAWGETKPKDDYSRETYKWSIGLITKYCQDERYGYEGFTDDKVVLDPEDDAVHVNLGGNWRMPTHAEMTELLDLCTWEWTTQNDVGGRLVTGPNGNSIFLPASGFWDDTGLVSVGGNGAYWSSSLYTDYPFNAFAIPFNSFAVYGSIGQTRSYGYSIRPVYWDIIPVESISLNHDELILAEEGETATLIATVLPANTSFKSVRWRSSDATVATVSLSGVVTAVGQGSALITAITADGSMWATCNVTVLAGGNPYTVATPEAIDLGLPSGVKWASFNLGATAPEEYGDYFAWGETRPYYISLDPLIWKPEKETGYVWASYKWCMGTLETLTKYCTLADLGNNGFTDGKTVLDPEDDAAHVNLGGNWRMPTEYEMTELIEKCTWEWTQQNGVDGYFVTGPNGNGIFLPAAGFRCDTNLYGTDAGSYWSSSVITYLPFNACSMRGWGWYYNGCTRFYGLSVRPVTE